MQPGRSPTACVVGAGFVGPAHVEALRIDYDAARFDARFLAAGHDDGADVAVMRRHDDKKRRGHRRLQA